MASWDHGRQDSGGETVSVYYLIRLSAINQSQLGVEFFLRHGVKNYLELSCCNQSEFQYSPITGVACTCFSKWPL